MIYVFTEIKGYVTWVAEGPNDFDVPAERTKFNIPYDDLIKSKPEWGATIVGEAERHHAYKEFMVAMNAWEAKRTAVLKELCGSFGDIVEAFVNHLINNHGFKMHLFEQIEC